MYRQLLVVLEVLEQSRRLEATAKKQQLSRKHDTAFRREGGRAQKLQTRFVAKTCEAMFVLPPLPAEHPSFWHRCPVRKYTQLRMYRQLLVVLEVLEQSRRLEATAKKQQLSRKHDTAYAKVPAVTKGTACS